MMGILTYGEPPLTVSRDVRKQSSIQLLRAMDSGKSSLFHLFSRLVIVETFGLTVHKVVTKNALYENVYCNYKSCI